MSRSPPLRKSFRDRLPRRVSRSTSPAACAAGDEENAGNYSVRMIEFVTVGVIVSMLLFFYRSIVTVLLVLAILVLSLSATRAWWRSSATTTSSGCRRSRPAPGNPRDRRNNRLRDLPDRALSGGPHDRGRPGVGVLHDVSRHSPRGTGLGDDDRRRDVLPVVHPIAVLSDVGHPAGGRNGRCGACCADSWACDHHGREPLRTIRTQACHADSVLAPPRCRRRTVARLDPDDDDPSRADRPTYPARLPAQLQRPQVPTRRPAGETKDLQRPNDISPSPG